MKEILQLNLTEEEAIILQAVVNVGISTRNGNTTTEEDLKTRIYSMNSFMNMWPEASGSLANKMTELVKTSAELIRK
ncbi:MAG TPA: hypothetical protein ENI23_04500 [bacterium]|nr:hypothetical protein [bacterium]